jgi:DNA-binding transcriptional MerR regulator
LVKLYYRIGEVSQIVGVQPHVLRYWETEFRTIRPQKSHKGQRVYSRKDVEKLLKVKDLLKNQGFTIAGAKRKLREPGQVAGPDVEETAALASAPVMEATKAPNAEAVVAALAPERPVDAPAPLRMAVPLFAAPPAPATDEKTRESRARVREALVSIREDIIAMLHSGESTLDAPPRRPKLPTLP